MKDTDYMEIFERKMDAPAVAQEDGLRILRELGLEFSSQPEMGDSWDYAQALATVGWGTWDYSVGTWTPSSAQVYAFDAEVFDVAQMYINYFKGLHSISQEELTFSDVVQDNSAVDWEAPGGTVTVRLCLNGMDCTYTVEFLGDWLDMRIQKAVNESLEKLGIQKRFYCTDVDQGGILFFCTEEWARKFEDATFCFMQYNGN